jgi:hypothetical protein
MREIVIVAAACSLMGMMAAALIVKLCAVKLQNEFLPDLSGIQRVKHVADQIPLNSSFQIPLIPALAASSRHRNAKRRA